MDESHKDENKFDSFEDIPSLSKNQQQDLFELILFFYPLKFSLSSH